MLFNLGRSACWAWFSCERCIQIDLYTMVVYNFVKLRIQYTCSYTWHFSQIVAHIRLIIQNWKRTRSTVYESPWGGASKRIWHILFFYCIPLPIWVSSNEILLILTYNDSIENILRSNKNNTFSVPATKLWDFEDIMRIIPLQ